MIEGAKYSIKIMIQKLYKYCFIFIFIILSILITGFIFQNSLQDSQTSNAQSNSIAEVIKPIVDPNNQVEEITFHKMTRKLAHGVEFCVLGCSVGALMFCINAVLKHTHVFMMLFYLLSAAVTDEYIQSFTGRTSSVKDIFIDFAGAVIGLVFIIVIVTLFRKSRWHKT